MGVFDGRAALGSLVGAQRGKHSLTYFLPQFPLNYLVPFPSDQIRAVLHPEAILLPGGGRLQSLEPRSLGRLPIARMTLGALRWFVFLLVFLALLALPVLLAYAVILVALVTLVLAVQSQVEVIQVHNLQSGFRFKFMVIVKFSLENRNLK